MRIVEGKDFGKIPKWAACGRKYMEEMMQEGSKLEMTANRN